MTLAYDTQAKYNGESYRLDGQPIDTEAEMALSIEAMLSNKQLRLNVLRVIDQLPDTERALVRLRDLEGFSTYETAEITGMHVCCVKTGLHLARIWLTYSMATPMADLTDGRGRVRI